MNLHNSSHGHTLWLHPQTFQEFSMQFPFLVICFFGFLPLFIILERLSVLLVLWLIVVASNPLTPVFSHCWILSAAKHLLKAELNC